MLKTSLSRNTGAAWAMLGAGLLATFFASLQVKQGIEQDAVKQFAVGCDQATLKIQERLDSYALILRGGAALFAASSTVERQAWRAYVETLRAQQSVPGVQGIGFAQVIPAQELATHIAHIRSEGFPNYTVNPAGPRALYTAIIYLEPFRDRNLRAFGFDMFTEPVRRAAMEQARDSGEATLSGKVELVQETGTEVQAGTLMYVPVYRNGMPRDTLEQRRAALIGWAYSPYRMDDLMTGLLREWEGREGKTIDLHIYDGLQASPVALLFDSKAVHAPNVHSLFNQQRTVDFNGRQWLLLFDDNETAVRINYTDAVATLMGGLVLSGLLFGLMRSRINTRSNAARIADQLTEEIRRRSDALKESESRWKFAIEGSGDGLWDWNVADNTVFFSKRWKEMLGFAENEIGTGLDEWEKRIHPEDLADTLATLQNCLNGKRPIYVSEHRIRCKDGSDKWILDRGMVVSRSEDGKPLRMIGTHTDISERKQAEEAVRAASQYARSLIEASLDPLVTISAEGKITDVNRATEAVTGRRRSELIGTDFSDYFTEPDRAGAGYQQVFAEGFVTDYPLVLRHRDGHLTDVLYNASVYRDAAGDVLGVFAAARDVTERKEAERKISQLNCELEQRVAERTAQLEAANKELEAFAYSVSHDLRTPLRAIDGFSRILLDDYTDKLDDEGKRLLNVVRDNTSRMGQLIDDILKFSRTGRLELSFARIDMEKLAHDVFEELLPSVGGDKLQLEIEQLPPASGDSAMMRQVFVNLLSNAIKFSRTKADARIKVGGAIEGDETIYYVQDNGVGFDMQYVDKLFGVFQRLHGVTEFEGTGIGLAIVKRIITRHGGRVWAQGKVNEGATFYFALPTKEAAHE